MINARFIAFLIAVLLAIPGIFYMRGSAEVHSDGVFLLILSGICCAIGLAGQFGPMRVRIWIEANF